MKQVLHSLYISIIMLSSNTVIAQTIPNGSIEWTVIGQLPFKNSGLAGAFMGVNDKWLWIGGGANFPDALPWEGGKKKFHKNIYLFQKSDGKKNQLIQQVKTDFMPEYLAYGVSIQTGNATICVGGENEMGHTASAYKISMREKDTALIFEHLPDLPVALSNAAGAYYNGYIFIAGGETDKGTCNYFFQLDTRSTKPEWEKLPALPIPVSHSVLITQKNGSRTSLYLIGGRTKTSSGISKFYDDVYEYDLLENRWKECHKMPYALSAHTSVALNNSHILIVGGDKGETFRQVEKLITAIRNESNSAKKEKLNQEKNYLLRSHQGFSREVLIYNSTQDKWKAINPFPMESRVTTTAISWNNEIIIPSGEIRAGIRSPQIIMGKINLKRGPGNNNLK